MVNYGVTVDIRSQREKEWVKYMLPHIQNVLDTGHFMDFRFTKLKSQRDGYARYRVEYFCDTMHDYELYQASDAKPLQDEHSEKFHGDFFAARDVTVADVLNELYYGNPARLFETTAA